MKIILALSFLERTIIGNKMLKYRKQKGLTQSEVAELADISDRTYADIERGSTNLRTATLLSICSALNITPNDLLVDEKNPVKYDIEAIFEQINNCSQKEQETALKLLSIYLDSI